MAASRAEKTQQVYFSSTVSIKEVFVFWSLCLCRLNLACSSWKQVLVLMGRHSGEDGLGLNCGMSGKVLVIPVETCRPHLHYFFARWCIENTVQCGHEFPIELYSMFTVNKTVVNQYWSVPTKSSHENCMICKMCSLLSPCGLTIWCLVLITECSVLFVA